MSWKVVTDEAGQEYYEFEGRINAPWVTYQDGGSPVMTVAPDSQRYVPLGVTTTTSSTDGYTLNEVFAMRNAMWDTRWPDPYVPPVTVNRWLPGDPDPAEPEQPSGRFQNLDWP